MAAPILGDLLFRAASLWTRLAGNTTTTVKFLRQTGTGAASAAPSWNQVADADLSLTDVTTNNSSTAAHGFLKKLDNSATTFMNGQGNWATPAGAGNVSTSATLTAGKTIIGAGTTAIDVSTLTAQFVGSSSGTAAAASMTTARMLGRTSASSGVVEEITVGSGLSLSSGTLTSTGGGGSGLTWIEETTPTGTSTTFSSLGSFTHLRLYWSARGDQVATSTQMNLTFNGDTGSNYDRENSSAAAAALAAAESLGATSAAIGNITAASGTADMAGSGVLDIMDYRGTTFQKGGVAQSVLRRSTASGNTLLQAHGIGWRSTAAITSITITLASGNFVTGSKFTLYGLQ